MNKAMGKKTIDYGNFKLTVQGDGSCFFWVSRSITNHKLVETLRQVADEIEGAANMMSELSEQGSNVVKVGVGKDALDTMCKHGYIQPLKFDPEAARKGNIAVEYTLCELLEIFKNHFAAPATA